MSGREEKEDENKRTVIEIDNWKQGSIMSCPLIYCSFCGRWYRGKGNVYAQSLKITLTVDQRTYQALFHTYLETSLMNSFSRIFPLFSPHTYVIGLKVMHSKLHSPLFQWELFFLFFLLWSVVITGFRWEWEGCFSISWN